MHTPEEVQLSVLAQLDEDQEATVKRGIRVGFNVEPVSVCEIALIW